MELSVQPIEYGRGRWAFEGLGCLFHKPCGRQQLPQLVREPQRWSVGPPSFENFAHHGQLCADIVEWRTPRNNLPRGSYDSSIRIKSAHLKDCHSECIDIRTPRGKPFPMLANEAELFRIHHLWRHPSYCAPHSAVVGSAPGG